MEEHKFEKSAACISKCLDLCPVHIPGLIAMGNLLFATGHSDKAVNYHKKALEVNSEEL